MSLKALQLLESLGLISKGQPADLSRFDDKTLEGLLSYYAESRSASAETETRASAAPAESLSVLYSTISAKSDINTLLASSLVYARIFTEDPLFRHGHPADEATRVQMKSLGIPPREGADRQSIARDLSYVATLSPLIKQGNIELLPMYLLHKAPAEKPLHFSPDRFKSQVPAHIYEFVHQSAIIKRMEPRPGIGMVVVAHEREVPTRGISIGFKDDVFAQRLGIFIYYDMVPEAFDGNKVTVDLHAPFERPPVKAVYDAWVDQSINRMIIDRLDGVAAEARVAQLLGAQYVTESAFESRICGMASNSGGPIDAVRFLRANIPSLRLESGEIAARLRDTNRTAIESFQRSILDMASAVANSRGGFDEMSQEVFRKEIDPQIEDYRMKLHTAAAAIGGGAVVAAATILTGLAFASGPVGPLFAALGAGALAGGAALPYIPAYIDKRKRPAFIWSRLSK